MSESLARLHDSLQYHLVNTLRFSELRPIQEAAISPILDGKNVLLLAPTAGGKTEAAIFPLLSAMLADRWQPVSILYISPLRALLNNQEPRFEQLLNMVGRRAFKWHGDVGPSARARVQREPPDVILTTPESLEVILLSPRVSTSTILGHVRAIVIDEVHAFAGDDRGAHLMALLERVVAHCRTDVQRIGLSATIGNPDEVLSWMQGSSRRPTQVVDPPRPTALSPDVHLDYVGTVENAARIILEHHPGWKRLVFCDSRSQAEEIGSFLQKSGASAFVIHSSLSQDERQLAEQNLLSRPDAIVVATSALELGIDIGDLDFVYQVGCPSTVSSFLQRMGRTGRREGMRPSLTFLTLERKNHFSLLQAAGLLRLWRRGFVEGVRPCRWSIHILAHQLLALALQECGVPRSDWWAWIGAAAPFRTISRAERELVVTHMLAEQILAEIDGTRLILGSRGERLYGFKNFFELYGVFDTPDVLQVVHGSNQIGTLDAAFVHQREGRSVVFSLGGRSWRMEHVDWKRKRVHAVPSSAEGKSGWTGAPFDLSWDLCQAMGEVLTDDVEDEGWTKRAVHVLATLRDEHRFLRELTGRTREVAPAGTEWWTFAGVRANGVLATAIERELGGEGATWDNLRITVPTHSAAAVHEAILELEGIGFERGDVCARAAKVPRARLSKFQPCLPPDAEERYVAERIFDFEGAERALDRETSRITAAEEAAPSPMDVRPSERVRVPKPSQRRPIDEASFWSATQDRLTRVATQAPRGRSRAPSTPRSGREWECELVLLDPSAGGLVLEAQALPELPRFVKTLEVHAGTWSRVVLASNMRPQVSRTSVPPIPGAYVWTAPGFDAEMGQDLASLRVGGPAPDRPTVFKVDAKGIGRRTNEPRCRSGSAYRALIPPQIPCPETLRPTQIAPGWRYVELDLAQSTVDASALHALGLELIGPRQLTLAWTGVPPRSYRNLRDDERAPVFHPTDRPTVRLDMRGQAQGRGWAVVAGTQDLTRYELSLGSLPLILEFGDLRPGTYVVEAFGEDSALGRHRLPLVVDEGAAPAIPTARCTVHLAGKEVAVAKPQRLQIDLAHADLEDLAVVAPPYWPIKVTWLGARPTTIAMGHADADGSFGVTEIQEFIRKEVGHELHGDLRVDFGDLGRLTLEHDLDVRPQEISAEVSALFERAGMSARSNDLRLMLKGLIEPVLEILGYRLRALDEHLVQAVPHGGAAALLVTTSRANDRRIESRLDRAVILLKGDVDLSADRLESVRRCLVDLGVPSIRGALVTNGQWWTVVEVHEAAERAPVSIPDALKDAAAFGEFLQCARPKA